MTRAALAVTLLICLAPALAAGAADAPGEQIRWAVHTTLVPTYFDPAETTIITSFMALFALHDAVVKPMPGKQLAPSLADRLAGGSEAQGQIARPGSALTLALVRDTLPAHPHCQEKAR